MYYPSDEGFRVMTFGKMSDAVDHYNGIVADRSPLLVTATGSSTLVIYLNNSPAKKRAVRH
jgi:hypothetical protein